MRLGAPDASGRRRPEPVPGTERPSCRRHGGDGDRPAPARRVRATGSTGSSSNGTRSGSTATGPTNVPRHLCRRRRDERRRDRRRGGARGQARRPRAWTPTLECVDERDPLARTRRAGREDRGAALRNCAPAPRARAFRRFPSTARSGAARRCGRTRGTTTGRSAGTTRSSSPDVVVVLEPWTSRDETDVRAGLASRRGFCCVNSSTPIPGAVDVAADRRAHPQAGRTS